MLTVCHCSRFRPLLMASLLAGLFSLPLVADACQITYTGRATAINAKIRLLGVTSEVVVADQGITCNGTLTEENVKTVRNPLPLLVRAKDVYAATQGIDGTALTESGVENLVVNIPGVKLTADRVQSQAEAECLPDESVQVRGTSTLSNVRLNNRSIAISGRPNQSIEIPGVATVVLNQQITRGVRIQVNGIIITVGGAAQAAGGDLRFASSQAGISSCDR